MRLSTTQPAAGYRQHEALFDSDDTHTVTVQAAVARVADTMNVSLFHTAVRLLCVVWAGNCVDKDLLSPSEEKALHPEAVSHCAARALTSYAVVWRSAALPAPSTLHTAAKPATWGHAPACRTCEEAGRRTCLQSVLAYWCRYRYSAVPCTSTVYQYSACVLVPVCCPSSPQVADVTSGKDDATRPPHVQ